MNEKILLDTNILMDLVLAREAGYHAAVAIAESVAELEIEACICATSLKDVYYMACKIMPEKEAREYITAMMEDFTILGVDLPVCMQATLSNEPDFEDGIIRICAENAGVDFIISHDEKAFKNSKIKRLTSEEYVKEFL